MPWRLEEPPGRTQLDIYELASLLTSLSPTPPRDSLQSNRAAAAASSARTRSGAAQTGFGDARVRSGCPCARSGDAPVERKRSWAKAAVQHTAAPWFAVFHSNRRASHVGAAKVATEDLGLPCIDLRMAEADLCRSAGEHVLGK
jgi:hypothetical protein